MSTRLALESWQLLFPAIGLGIFAAIFLGVVFRVWRMKPPRVERLGHLPLEEESSHRVDAGVPPSSSNSQDQCHCEERSDEAIHPAGSPRPRSSGSR